MTARMAMGCLFLALMGRAPDAAANGRIPDSVKLVVRPEQPERMIFGVTFGLLESTDGGTTWRWICESAVGFSGTYDPDYELSATGALIATTFDGMTLTRDRCQWQRPPAPVGTSFVTSVAVGADGAIWAGTSDPVAGSAIFKSTDDGASFSPTAPLGRDGDWWESIAVAPSDPARVYVTAFRTEGGLPRRRLLFRTRDAGATWAELPTSAFIGTDASVLSIASIHPTDPDRVFVRMTLTAATLQERFYRTTDAGSTAPGGPTWQFVLEVADEVPGFAIRTNGEVWAGGLTLGLFRSIDDGQTFTPVPVSPPVNPRCLREGPGNYLYACGYNLPPDGAALTRTLDGQTWEPVLTYSQIEGPVRCEGDVPQRQECENRLWCGLVDQFGIVGSDVDCTREVDAPGWTGSSGGGCCDSGDGASASLILVIALLWRRPRRLWLLVTFAGCMGDNLTARSVEELLKPEACMECHPTHVQEWSGSMHAYAADDPVFLAMNRLGQEETGGALGDFCVQCHAPVAHRLGLTTDGLNLTEVPQWAKGVTCYFCHNVVEVLGEHNNPIRLAMDQTMRGGLLDPVPSPAHFTAYSPLVDADREESSSLCGSCHDIVTPAGIHLERTFAEWKETIFGQDNPRTHLSCAQCHMVARTDVVAESPDLDVPLRPFGRREHTFPGIDVALTPWPEKDAQLAAIDRDLKGVLLPRLCVLPEAAGRIDYRLDNIGAGHMFPSGATADRRVWAEIIAYDANDQVVFASGTTPPSNPYVDPEHFGDPNLWQLGTEATDANGQPTELFWRVASLDHPGTLLKPAVTIDPMDPRFYHAVERSFPIPGLLPQVRRVTARVLARPVPMRFLEELRSSGHLTEDLRSQVPTHVIGGTVLEWRAGGPACVP